MEFSLLVLFWSAFLAATILPVSSEVVLAAIIAGGTQSLWLPVAVATLGNSLGSVVNWFLGRFLSRYAERDWFPLSPARHEKAGRWFRRYGVWSLLLAWVPILGDPLTVVAGLLHVPLRIFLPLVVVGKAARYIFLVLVVQFAVELG